jgi:hypothetical protein
MSPIKGVSDIRRLPRLGKIRLGEKVKAPGKNPYPRALDHFNVPEEIRPYVGEKPKKLIILFPVEDAEVFAPQFLKCYSLTQGLVCRGDGVKCTRKVDIETGGLANHSTEHWEFREMTCDPDTCPEAVGNPEMGIRPQCRRVMNLLFVLPDVPGLGVWQLDTSSFYSIVNINSCIDVIRGLCGRISGIPLTLSLEPREVTPPGMKKKTVHVLHLRSDLKLSQLQRLALKAPAKRLAMPQVEEEEPPEDLFPPEVLAEAEEFIPTESQVEGPRDNGQEPGQKPTGAIAPAEPKRDPETIRSINDLLRACHEDFKMQPKEVYAELNVSSANEITELPSDCYRKIAAVRG